MRSHARRAGCDAIARNPPPCAIPPAVTPAACPSPANPAIAGSVAFSSADSRAPGSSAPGGGSGSPGNAGAISPSLGRPSGGTPGGKGIAAFEARAAATSIVEAGVVAASRSAGRASVFAEIRTGGTTRSTGGSAIPQTAVTTIAPTHAVVRACEANQAEFLDTTARRDPVKCAVMPETQRSRLTSPGGTGRRGHRGKTHGTGWRPFFR